MYWYYILRFLKIDAALTHNVQHPPCCSCPSEEKLFRLFFSETGFFLTVVTATNRSPGASLLSQLCLLLQGSSGRDEAASCEVEWPNGPFPCSWTTCCCLTDICRFGFGAFQMQRGQLHRGVRLCWERWVGLGRSSFRKPSPSRVLAGTGRGFSSGLRHCETWMGEKAKHQMWGCIHFCFSSVSFYTPGLV